MVEHRREEEIGDNLCVNHHEEYFEEVIDTISDQRPMFDGSRLNVQSFCTDFVLIATTFDIPERACNDLLSLVKRYSK